MGITIKEIARLAEVSPTSVSLVLNEKTCRIPQETKDKIKAIAKEHKYKVNIIARSLVTKKSHVLGLLLPNIENAYFSSITKSIEVNAQSQGYSVILTHSNDCHKNDLKLITELIERGVDGLFLILSDESFKEAHFEKIKEVLESSDVPFVLIDRVVSNYDCNKVYVDNEQGGYIVGKYLIEQGHTHIGYLHNSNSLNGKKRIMGFERALAEAKIEVCDKHITEGDFSIESGYQAAQCYEKGAVTAIFASNDLMGYGLIKNFNERGIVPQTDIEIVGYDNLFFTSLFEFCFNSVDQSISDIGREAFQILMDNIQDKSCEAKEACINPTLSINRK